MLDAKRLVIVGLVVGLFTAGCGGPKLLTQKTALGDKRVVAQADRGYSLTVEQLFHAMSESPIALKGATLGQDSIVDFRDSMVADTLAGFAADEEIDLSKHWADFWAYRFRNNTFLLGTYLDKHVYSKITADSAQIAEFYKQHTDYFNSPEQVEISQIMTSAIGFLASPDSAKYKLTPRPDLEKLAHERILLIKHLLDSGMSFKQAAVQYSHEVHARRDSGYVGWTGRTVYRPPFDSIAFSLKPGTYSDPYQDADGWHIIFVHAYLPEGPRSFDHPNVFATSQKMLLTEKANKLLGHVLDSVAQNATFTINEPLLDSNLYNVTDSLWFAVINGIDTIDVLMMRNAEDPVKQRYKVWNTTPEQKRQVVVGLVRQFSAIQAARKDRMDTLPAVVAKAAEMRHEALKIVIRREYYDREWKPTDSAIQAYYAANMKEFLVDKPLTVQQIVSKDSVMAIFLRDQARSGVDFMQLAKQYYPGEPSVRMELADLGKIGPNDVDTAFYRAAYAIDEGGISDPVKTRYGWHVIKVLKHEESKTLDDARVQIISKLTRQYQTAQFEAFKHRLFAKYNAKFPYTPKSLFLEPLAYRKKHTKS